MAWQRPDYYGLLGVRRGFSAAELDRAYRRAARATHPDVHPHDASAAERFRAVAVAYETLSDPGLRAAYDRAHPPLRHGGSTRIVVREGRPTTVPPVRLGERRQPEQLDPLRTGRPHPFDDLERLFEALTRLVLDGGSIGEYTVIAPAPRPSPQAAARNRRNIRLGH
jgi:curved DNA-binding protein CbpA